MADPISISKLSENDQVDGLLAVRAKKGFGPYAKGFSLRLQLADKDGRGIELVHWGDQNEQAMRSMYDAIHPNNIVHVKGRVGTFQGKLQLSSSSPHTLQAVDAPPLIRKSKKDPEVMYSELKASANMIGHVGLRQFVLGIISEEAVSRKLKEQPAALMVHHNWLGGLLEHLLEVLEYCKLSLELYPELDKDILIAGAILHDIGKLKELSLGGRIERTAEGELLGPITQGVLILSRRLEKAGLDAALRAKLLHLVISHQGKREFGSPKPPMLPEAIVLHLAKELSSKTSESLEFVRQARESSDEDFAYHRRWGRSMYLR